MTVTTESTAQPVINYNYDAADKLTSVSQNGFTTSKACTDAAGRLKTLTLSNNLAVTYAYDKDSHVTSLTYGSLGTLTYGYDADGRRTSVAGSFARTTIPAAQTFSHNPDNSLKTVGSYTATNDSDGNVLCIGIGTDGCPWYSYDERGHLQQARSGSSTFDFSYDAFGRRYEINFGGLVVTCYVYDGLNPVATTFECASSLGVTSYLGGLGLDELFTVNNGSNESFLRDALNSTIALTNSSGSIVDQTTYDPYGNTTDSAPSSASAFEYTGRENDGTFGGLYYMRARYYSPQLARFISRDPASLADGINLYAYAGDDPIDFSDPMGLDSLEGPGDVCSGCIGGFVGQPVFSGPSPLANQNGLDGGIVEFYDGSQNGGGQRGPIIRVQEEPYIGPGESLVEPEGGPGENVSPDTPDEPTDPNDPDQPNAGHRKGKRPSTKEKHEQGDRRRRMDRRGVEKGDKRRPYRQRGLWWLLNGGEDDGMI